MKNLFILFCIFFIIPVCTQAQEMESPVNTLAAYAIQDTTQGWKHSGIAGITFGQTSLNNWMAGGDNTLSGNFILNASANYLKDKWFWDNNLSLEYGMIYSSAYDWQKAADKINFKSIAGRNFSNKWSASFLVNFYTQFAKGYKYPEAEQYISAFMAPAYADAALGFTYKPNANYNLFISPVAERAILVLNDSLSNLDLGVFGVETGKKVKWETGFYLMASANQTVAGNLSIISSLDLFTPYNKNFGNVNVNWNLLLNYKLNKLLTATLNTTLRYYDAEIRKVQFKEILGLGLTYTF